MKSWIIGVFVIAVIVGGFVLSTGYASDGSNSDGQVANDFTSNEKPSMIPQTMDSLTSMPAEDEKYQQKH